MILKYAAVFVGLQKQSSHCPLKNDAGVVMSEALFFLSFDDERAVPQRINHLRRLPADEDAWLEGAEAASTHPSASSSSDPI